MYFGFPNRLPKSFRHFLQRHSLEVRLMLGYALTFIASVGLLFALSYLLMRGFMREQDHALLESSLQKYASIYTGESLSALRREVQADGREVELLVRVSNAQGRMLYRYNTTDLEPSEAAVLNGRVLLQEDGDVQRLQAAEDDEAVEVAALRLPDGAVLQVGLSTEDRREVLASFLNIFIIIALPVLLLGIMGGAFMAHRALRPGRDLLRTLEAVADTGDLHERVSAGSAPGPFAELARLFNRMLNRIEALVAGLRHTLDDAAHDLRTPMTHLRGQAELALQDARTEEDYRNALADTLEASDRIMTILDTLMEVSEAEAGALHLRLEKTAATDLISDIAAFYRYIAQEKDIELEARVAEDLYVMVDRSRMRQALANLLDNAVKYTPTGGRVSIEVERNDHEALFRISDSGVGIDSEELPRIWDRLYRGDRSRSERGLGLGLSQVKAIVEAHDGMVGAESEPGEGSIFILRLPRTGI